MLHLLAVLEGQTYAIEGRRVAEVLPLVRLDLPPGPEHLATFRHRGRLASALDLSRLLLGRPFTARLSTRILVVRPGDGAQVVGLVAENLTQTLSIQADAWEAVRRPGEPPHLGPAAMTEFGPVRRLELEALLAAAFPEPAA